MAEIGADGINGDTQDGVPSAYAEAAERIGHPFGVPARGGPHDEAITYDVFNWANTNSLLLREWIATNGLKPGTWSNISDRWNRDKTDDLQFAFFNGIGWESWENIWASGTGSRLGTAKLLDA